ncbi:hypothetical protein Tco_1371606 [Tanacetum coccineum]
MSMIMNVNCIVRTPTLSLAEPSGEADDEEVIEEGISTGHVLGYENSRYAMPHHHRITSGPEDHRTPPGSSGTRNEHEAYVVQAHDPDYVPKPIYPEYIPFGGYVTESDPLGADPEEYEDDETEDGLVDYPMDGGDDGDNDDGDSSKDDANDEDGDDEDEEEEEEEHLAPADSAIVVHVDEPVFPLEGTEPVIPPPSTDITIGARITIRPQASISLPPEAEERLTRCMALHAHSSPLLPSSGCPTQIQTLRITSTQALIDVVTAALPYHHLYTYHHLLTVGMIFPSLSKPSCKRLYLSTLGSRYEVGESSTARPTRGRGIDYGFISKVIDIATAAEYSHSDTALDMRREMSDMQAELLALREQQRRARQPRPEARILDHQDASGFFFGDAGQRIMAPTTRRGPNTPVNNTNPNNMTPESIQAMIDQAILRNSTNGDGSHSSKVDKYISGLLDNIYGNIKSARPKTLNETIELANDLMDQKRTYAERQSENKRTG